MAFTGYNFDRAKTPASADGSLYDYLSLQRNGVIGNRGNNLAVTTTGLVCTIDTGQALIQGRLVEVTSPENVTIPANSTGYLCITVDLSQVNTSTGTPGKVDYTVVIGQLRIEFLETLTKQDLFNGGAIYNFNLGSVVSTDSTVTYTKNWDVYTPSIILPDGAIFGNGVVDYGSAMVDNRWYGSTGDLIVDIPAGRNLIIRNKDTGTIIYKFLSTTPSSYIFVQSTQPTNPKVNDLWVVTS